MILFSVDFHTKKIQKELLYCCEDAYKEYENNLHQRADLAIIKIFLYVGYSTQLHLPRLRFHCLGGCWNLTQDSQTL